jgi:hypothetical protein
MSVEAVRARALDVCGEHAVKQASLRNPGTRVWRNRMMLATLIDLAECQAFRLPKDRHPSVCAFANIELRSPEEAQRTGRPASAFLMSFNPQSANQCVITMEFKLCAWWRSPRVVPDGVVPDWHDADMEPWAEGAVAARLERRRLARRCSENKEKGQEDEAETRPRKVRITSANAAPLLGRTRARTNALVETQ